MNAMNSMVTEPEFLRMLDCERRRTERTERPLLLMLAELKEPQSWNGDLGSIIAALEASKRRTDVLGWYEFGARVGVLFNEINERDCSIVSLIESRVVSELEKRVGEDVRSRVGLSFHLFPQNGTTARAVDLIFYPDARRRRNYLSASLKRCVDLVIGATLLVLLSPLLVAISIAIKLTSKGPVFFRQRRIGQYGRPFTFLKFRSMYAECDSSMHQQYVTNLILGQAPCHEDNGKHVFKIVNDPRVTPLGHALRRSSMDELPQLLNVLRGDMSLVGPRPPLPYEFDKYSWWHKRRVIEAKPGITGLWQVSGRSNLGFNEMVRLDLAYLERSSIWLDLKILLLTPRAVFSGDGAY